MSPPNRVFGGRGRAELHLRESLGSGNYATVYRLERPHKGQVLKLYGNLKTARQFEAKIGSMLANRPHYASVADKGRLWHQLAWPTEKAFDERNRFVGYLMPEVDASESANLNLIFSQTERKTFGISGHYGFRLMVARNLAAVFANLHSDGICILDVKPDNIRFYKESGYICLLDCDSFISVDRSSAAMGAACTPGYILPEATVIGSGDEATYEVVGFRDKQDDFALAILIFRLMNEGLHPFSGVPKDKALRGLNEQERIFARAYSFGITANPAIAPTPHSLHRSFDNGTRVMFDRAFASRRRPTAREWLAHLQSFVERGSKKLVKCSVDPRHVHFSRGCGLCVREQALARLPAKSKAFGLSSRTPRPSPAPVAVPYPPSPSPAPIPPPTPSPHAFAASRPAFETPIFWAKVVGWVIMLWLAVSTLSCVNQGIRSFLGGSSAVRPAAQTTTPRFTVQPFYSPQPYVVAPGGGGQVHLRAGPGRTYMSLTVLTAGEEVTGNGSAVSTEGTGWIAVTLPNGTSGFIRENLLRARAESPAEPVETSPPPEPLDVSEPTAPTEEGSGQTRSIPGRTARQPAAPQTQGGYNEPVRTVTCFLPSGQETQLSSEQCRRSEGVVYQ